MSVKKNPDFGPDDGLSPGRNDSGPPTTLGDMPVTYLLDTAIAAALETAVAAGSALGAALGTIVTTGSGIGIAIGMESDSGPLSGPGGGGEDVDPDEDDDEGGTGTTGSPWKPWIPPDAPEQWPKNNKWDGTTERRGQKPQDGNDPDPDDDDFSDSIEWLMESLQPSHTSDDWAVEFNGGLSPGPFLPGPPPDDGPINNSIMSFDDGGMVNNYAARVVVRPRYR